MDPIDISEYSSTFKIPALLVGYLAVHEMWEGLGVGRHMMYWAMRKARDYSRSIGCRTVVVYPLPDAIAFYEKIGFTHAEMDYSMFFDIGRDVDITDEITFDNL